MYPTLNFCKITNRELFLLVYQCITQPVDAELEWAKKQYILDETEERTYAILDLTKKIECIIALHFDRATVEFNIALLNYHSKLMEQDGSGEPLDDLFLNAKAESLLRLLTLFIQIFNMVNEPTEAVKIK